MRSASSYRGAKKKAARERGVPFAEFNEHYLKSRMFAAHELERKALNASPEAARRTLAIWAANGGRMTAASPPVTSEALKRMNEGVLSEDLERTPIGEPIPPAPTVEQATESVKKLTVTDIDKALESALSRWQAAQNEHPMPLSKLFAARARQLGWVEDVEFVEEK